MSDLVRTCAVDDVAEEDVIRFDYLQPQSAAAA